MAEKKSRGRGKMPSRDITPMLSGWEYESGTINVRKIVGLDGLPKIQMRLDLGLLQMEISGRPDGLRPHGCESLLEYFEQQLTRHHQRTGSDVGFHLTPAQCESLREEALMYYHRYLSLFVLGDYRAVVRDTNRNLRVIDICGQFAEEEQDRMVLEQYRPYVLMMNARAKASMHVKRKDLPRALRSVRRGLRRIREFFTKYGQEAAYKHSNEARLLRSFARDLKQQMPTDPMAVLHKQLKMAITEERYEEAAKLRDEITKRGGKVGP